MILLLLLFSLAASDGDADFERFFTDFADKRDGIRAFEATYTQELNTLDDQAVTKGTIVFVQPRRIVLRYTDEGEVTVLLIDDLRGYEFEAESEAQQPQLQIFDLDDDPAASILFLGFDNDTKRLRKAWNVELFDPGEGNKGITLTPKDNDEPVFEQVRLFLRPQDYLPYRIEIKNDEESSSIIKINNFKINNKQTPEKAFIDLPEGTKIIVNREFKETVGPAGKRVPEAKAPEAKIQQSTTAP